MKLNDTDALIVVEVQNEFCRGGALALPEVDALVLTDTCRGIMAESVVAALNEMEAAGATIAATEDLE